MPKSKRKFIKRGGQVVGFDPAATSTSAPDPPYQSDAPAYTGDEYTGGWPPWYVYLGGPVAIGIWEATQAKKRADVEKVRQYGMPGHPAPAGWVNPLDQYAAKPRTGSDKIPLPDAERKILGIAAGATSAFAPTQAVLTGSIKAIATTAGGVAVREMKNISKSLYSKKSSGILRTEPTKPHDRMMPRGVGGRLLIRDDDYHRIRNNYTKYLTGMFQ